MSLSVQFSGVHCKPASSFWKIGSALPFDYKQKQWVYKAVKWIGDIFVIKNFHLHFPTSGKLNTHSREGVNVCIWFDKFFCPTHTFQTNMNFQSNKDWSQTGPREIYIGDFHISAIFTNNRTSMLSPFTTPHYYFMHRSLRSLLISVLLLIITLLMFWYLHFIWIRIKKSIYKCICFKCFSVSFRLQIILFSIGYSVWPLCTSPGETALKSIIWCTV